MEVRLAGEVLYSRGLEDALEVAVNQETAARTVYIASYWSSICCTSDSSSLSSSNGWNMTPLSDRGGGKFEGKHWRRRGGGPSADPRLQCAPEFGVGQEVPARP